MYNTYNAMINTITLSKEIFKRLTSKPDLLPFNIDYLFSTLEHTP